MRIQGFFKSFNFVVLSILGVFQGNLRQLGSVFELSRGVLAASWGALEALWMLLEACWRCLGGIWGHLGGLGFRVLGLGHLGRVLGKMSKNVDWAKLLKGVLRAKMDAKIIKIRV